jgi:2-polyprenyl-3-methyl-5-hydroxy-6-metoxy-1,4-benzoquinol methylase
MHNQLGNELQSTPPPCPVCASNRTANTGVAPRSPYLPFTNFRIVRCHNCGLLRTSPWPTPEQLHDVYESGHYYSTIEASQVTQIGLPLIERARNLIRSLVVEHHFSNDGGGVRGSIASAIFRRRFGWAPKGLQPGLILDVGCGDGAFLLDVQRAGWTASGLETSQTAVDNAAGLGLDVTCGSLEDKCYEDSKFDVVRMWSVLEHVSDPHTTLTEVVRILKPGGWAILQVPNANSIARQLAKERWSGWDIPAHLTHFTPETLRWTAAKAGLEPVELNYSSVGTLANWVTWGPSAICRILVFLVDQLCDLLRAGDCIVLFARRPDLRRSSD